MSSLFNKWKTCDISDLLEIAKRAGGNVQELCRLLGVKRDYRLVHMVRQRLIDEASFTFAVQRNRRTTDDEFVGIVQNAQCWSDVVRGCGLQAQGHNIQTAKKRVERLGLDVSHFDAAGAMQRNKKKHDVSSLVENSYVHRSALRRIVLTNNLLTYVCDMCKMLPEWMGKELQLQLDHINGKNDDNRIMNLRFLCPNCHSQTDTYGGKNNR